VNGSDAKISHRKNMPIPAKLCAVLPTLRGSYIIALPIKRHAQYAATQKSSNAIGNEVLVTTEVAALFWT
jgi:hypothetical protein